MQSTWKRKVIIDQSDMYTNVFSVFEDCKVSTLMMDLNVSMTGYVLLIIAMKDSVIFAKYNSTK